MLSTRLQRSGNSACIAWPLPLFTCYTLWNQEVNTRDQFSATISIRIFSRIENIS